MGANTTELNGRLISFMAFAVASLAVALGAAHAHGTELPPEIEIDRLLVQAERQIADGELMRAVGTLDTAVGLGDENGVDLPKVFWIRHAEASLRIGKVEVAAESATRYLQTAGRSGEHYRRALELLDEVEQARAEAAEQEAITRAAEPLRLLHSDFSCTWAFEDILDGTPREELVRQITNVEFSSDCRLRINTRYISDGREHGSEVDTIVRRGNVIWPAYDEEGALCGPRFFLEFGSREVDLWLGHPDANYIVENWFSNSDNFKDYSISIPLPPDNTLDEESIIDAVRTFNRLCEGRR